PAQAAEVPEQCPPPSGPHALDGIELRAEAGAAAERAMIGVREAMRLVADALQEEQCRRVRAQEHRVLPPGGEDAVWPALDLTRQRVARHALLGESHHRELVQTERGQDGLRGPELPEAPVDDQQVRRLATSRPGAKSPFEDLGDGCEIVGANDR